MPHMLIFYCLTHESVKNHSNKKASYEIKGKGKVRGIVLNIIAKRSQYVAH